jgi:hypothetical protein
MFAVAMTPNQDLSTKIISNRYSEGLEPADGKTLYIPSLIAGPPRWAPRDLHSPGAN